MPLPTDFMLTLPETLAGTRLDVAITGLLPDYSRATIQRWIREGVLTLNGQPVRMSQTVQGHETIAIQATDRIQPVFQPQAIALAVLFEDDALLVINKSAGMVVHPAPGHPDQTLLNALLHHAPPLASLPRAGIIHRLDRETSGLLVIAKTASALTSLSRQLRARTIMRGYQTIVTGTPISGGTITAPMGRHPVHRKRMAVIPEGRPAVSHYRIAEKFRAHTRLRIQLETGRTHQIRVHLAHAGYPVAGDPLYGGRLRLPRQASPELVQTLRGFRRQALHAERLELLHPLTLKPVQFTAPLPEDMQTLIQVLRHDTAAHIQSLSRS